MCTASGNIYVLSNSWGTLTNFQISVAIVSLVLALLVTVVRLCNFQEMSIRGLHAATSLSSIAHDIVLNQSLRPHKRQYAGIFIQNIVKRTEAVINLAYPMDIKEKKFWHQHHKHLAKLHNQIQQRKPSMVTFNQLIEDVHKETGVCPKEMFSKAHLSTRIAKEHVYMSPQLAPCLSPPTSMAAQVRYDSKNDFHGVPCAMEIGS